MLVGALWTVGTLVALVAALPILLLFVATAVPLTLSLVLVVADVGLLVALFTLERTPLMVGGVLSGLLLTSGLAVWLSQVYATTPPITDATGEVVSGSVASLEKVQLGDSDQWISIRGHDADNPVLLFLAGGPGGTQLGAVRRSLAGLEKHFVVVNWEQPGAGKSFNARKRATLTPGQYVSDGLELTRYLRGRFGREKIYLLGESWGSALGILMVQRQPELFHAFAGTGQMVAFLETDLLCYDLALEWAEERGDARKVTRLERQGPPPYYGRDVGWLQATYLLDTYAYMNQNPAIRGRGFDTFADLASVEYGLVDKLNWIRGPIQTLGVVYPQLWDVDFRTQATELEVPAYFLIGRHDVNAPVGLTEEYYELLDAPHKELVWFEHSGHSPWIQQPDAFVEAMVGRVLADARVE